MNNRLFKKIYPGSSTDTIIKILNENFDNLERELERIDNDIKKSKRLKKEDAHVFLGEDKKYEPKDNPEFHSPTFNHNPAPNPMIIPLPKQEDGLEFIIEGVNKDG